MKIFFLIVLSLISFWSIAQKQGDYWYFGNSAGLHFSTGSPVAIHDGKTATDLTPGDNQEGTACISDSAGNLLFYTGGRTIWNKEHNPMPNGTGLLGGPSSTQSSIIVPLPGSDNLFYVFTSDEFQNYSSPHIQNGYRYSVVDMCLDSGRGDVLIDKKNILLVDSSTEKLAACEDINGNGYWIMGHTMLSHKFYAWHLTSAGITNTVISDIGMLHGWHLATNNFNSGSAQGQMKFNPQGTKLAFAMGNYDPAVFEIFDFNNSTGVLSNLCHFSLDSIDFHFVGKRAYGIEFSPDGSKLYAGLSGGAGNPSMNQFNLAAGGCDAIVASRVILLPSNTIHATGLQIGPDNKIYITQPGAFQGCINFPDVLGTGADFNPVAVDISPAVNGYAFPAFIAGYKYHNRIPCDTTSVNPTAPPVIETIDSSCNLSIKTRLYPNPTGNILLVDKKPTKCKVTMRLYNVLGQTVMKNVTIKDGTTQIRLSGLSVGVYYYKFVSDERTVFTGTVVKQ